MKYELFIANRYLRSKRRTGFISLITYLSAAGVTIGVAALVIVLSVTNGFEVEVRDRILGADSHIKLTLFHEAPMRRYDDILEQLLTFPHVIGGSPFIMGKGMLRHGRSVEGVLVKGIDETTVGQVENLPEIIIAGELRLKPLAPQEKATSDERLFDPEDNETFRSVSRELQGIILGKQLSFRLGAAIGDSVIAISPTGLTSLLSSPVISRFVVTGIFETGIFEYDDTYSYISLEAAQDLFLLGSAITGLEFKLDHIESADQVKSAIEDSLGYPYFVRTWYDMHSTLFRWMKLEKWLYTILLSLIILVAAFNIVSSQIMMVLEKRREIGILKAIGASNRGIMRIFLYEGLIVGVIGTFLGLVLGWATCMGQVKFQWFSLPGDVYFLSSLPVRMQVQDFIIISIVSLVLTLLATVYPARRASALDPVDAIRYE